MAIHAENKSVQINQITTCSDMTRPLECTKLIQIRTNNWSFESKSLIYWDNIQVIEASVTLPGVIT